MEEVDRNPKSGERPNVGIVIPTLGTRPEFLAESIASVRDVGAVFIVLVRPTDALIDASALQLVDHVVDDPGQGLSSAINEGLRSMPEPVEFMTWLGDDDRLVAPGFCLAVEELGNSTASGVFGQCRYIDEDGSVIWLNKSGRWSVPLMSFGPQLVPQPGSLVRRSVFEEVGLLDTQLNWAFDLDLFLKIRRIGGGLAYVAHPVSDFRWHSGSLSVGGRRGSVLEASQVRQRHLPRVLRAVSKVWEPCLRFLILRAGSSMNRRLGASS